MAAECKAFATSPSRADAVAKPEDITIRIFDVDVRLYAVFFPVSNTPAVQPFWTHSGAGISSRLAEESLKHLDLLREVTGDESGPEVKESRAHAEVRERVAGLLERSLVSVRQERVSPDDVYLYQTGMSAIYHVQQYLLSRYNAKSVLFGFAFFSTPEVFNNFGPGMRHFGRNNEADLDALEDYLKEEAKERRKIQALWTEIPSNPILVTPDLPKLRKLADDYDFVLIIDDTVGSFCNIDVLDVADIVVTSLTKSFSGYADVMGASAVLNPSSKRYTELKGLFKEKFKNHLHPGDAETLANNSKDYLPRSTVLNNNALHLVTYLQSLTTNSISSIKTVYYPTTSPTLPLYQKYMRPTTADFTPGYGCLFSMEFENIEQTIAFYNALNVHNGPHLGAHLTLAVPYARGVYGSNMDFARQFGLKATQIRIAVGLEDTAVLMDEFVAALKVADAVKKEQKEAFEM